MKTETQPKPVMRIKISPIAKYEWQCKEEGSYDDHNRPETGHVYCLLTNHKRDILIHNKEEFNLLIKSATYNGGGSWDTGEKAVEAMMKACDRIKVMKYPEPDNQPQHTQGEAKLYVRTPLIGNEYKVCNESTDEVKAIFFSQQDALNYIKSLKAVNMHDELVNCIKSAYTCSGEKNYLIKPVLDEMLKLIKQSEQK